MRLPFLSALVGLHLETQDMFVAVWFEFSSRRRPVEGFSHEMVYSVPKRRSRGSHARSTWCRNNLQVYTRNVSTS